MGWVGGWVVGGGIRLYGKGYLPTERTGKEHYVCVRGCTWGVRAQTQILQTCMREQHFRDSCIPDIPSCEFPVIVRLTVPEL